MHLSPMPLHACAPIPLQARVPMPAPTLANTPTLACRTVVTRVARSGLPPLCPRMPPGPRLSLGPSSRPNQVRINYIQTN